MPSSTVKRQSAAVMFTDIAGYTSIMASDEEKALSLLQEKRKVLKPLIDKHDGIYVKGTGDGTLSYFDSAYNASKCAKLFQESIYDNKNMNVRVGIHVGDIVLDDGDVYGDGVNVASRLESMSPVGGICVSNTVYDELRNKKEFDGVELGLQSLKGVGRLIEVYGLKGERLSEPKPNDYQDNKVAVHTDDEVPSIAIIPFDNKGADEDVFYAYGISADLIADCSSAGLIRVAGLKEIEELGDISFKEKAKQLFVRYVATGTLWKMDDMFQLSIELYDTKEKKVIWSDRWEEGWDSLPSIKLNLSDGLLKALDTKINKGKTTDTTSAEAYEYYLRGSYVLNTRFGEEEMEIARRLLQKAIDLDSNIWKCKNLIATSCAIVGNNKTGLKIWKNNLEEAKSIDNKEWIAGTLSNIGHQYMLRGDFDKAMDYEKKSIKTFNELNFIPKRGLGWPLKFIGQIYQLKGDYDKSIEFHNKQLEANKNVNNLYGIASAYNYLGCVHAQTGNYNDALNYLFRSIETLQKRHLHRSNIRYSWIASIYSILGDYNNAINYSEKSIKNNPINYSEKSKKNNSINYEGRSSSFTRAIIHQSLSYKKLGKKYNEKEIIKLVQRDEKIDYDNNYHLYQLLKDKSYLETAYNQIQEKAANLEPDVAAKFLSYPIPKAIVEEWEKVK